MRRKLGQLLVIAIASLAMGLGIGGAFARQHGDNAVQPLALVGGALFIVFALLASTAQKPTRRIIWLVISMVGCGAMIVGFGIMYKH